MADKHHLIKCEYSQCLPTLLPAADTMGLHLECCAGKAVLTYPKKESKVFFKKGQTPSLTAVFYLNCQLYRNSVGYAPHCKPLQAKKVSHPIYLPLWMALCNRLHPLLSALSTSALWLTNVVAIPSSLWARARSKARSPL